jgi:hypothetical protein
MPILFKSMSLATLSIPEYDSEQYEATPPLRTDQPLAFNGTWRSVIAATGQELRYGHGADTPGGEVKSYDEFIF